MIDEGIEDVDPDLQADVVGMTVITGTAPRAYELAAALPLAGHPRRARRPARHAGARRRAAACRQRSSSATPKTPGRSCCAISRAARFGRATSSSPACRSPDRPFPRRDLLPQAAFLTNNVFEATRGCIHNCDFCVVPAAWGRKPYQKPVEDVVADIRQHGARKLIFVDLNLIADRGYAARLFEALIPLRVQWYGLSTVLLAEDLPLLKLAARSGCRGLLLGFESISADNLRDSSKSFNKPAHFTRVVALLHAHGIAVYGCFVFGMDHDTPDVFLETARFAVDAQHRSAAIRDRHAVSRHRPLSAARARRPHPDAQLGALRRPARGLPAARHDDRAAAARHRRRVAARRIRCRSIARRLPGIAGVTVGSAGIEPRLSPLRAQPSPLLQLRLDHRQGWHGSPCAVEVRRRCDGGAVRLTLIHPCIGRRAGQRYIRSWQMEPLPPATIAGLTPSGRRHPLLRRSDGADSVRRADRPRGHQRRDIHGASAPTRSPANTARAAFRS